MVVQSSSTEQQYRAVVQISSTCGALGVGDRLLPLLSLLATAPLPAARPLPLPLPLPLVAPEEERGDVEACRRPKIERNRIN